MKIVEVPLKSIKPYANNPRVNAGAVDAVAVSIKEFGFNQPIVLDGANTIVVGHTRVLAAQKLGMKTVPAMFATGLTAAQAQAYRIADNQTASLSYFDQARLVAEIAALEAMHYPLSNLGFDDSYVADLLRQSQDQQVGDPEHVPEPPDKATTQLGDIWILGKGKYAHRLLCGDSGHAKDIDRLMDGNLADLVVTDPPYNVCLEPRSNNAIRAGLSSFPLSQSKSKRDVPRPADGCAGHHQGFDEARKGKGKVKATHAKLRPKDQPLLNDFLSDAEYCDKLDAWFASIARVLRPGGVYYCFGGYANVANYPPALAKYGLYFSQALIWDKLHPVLTRKDFLGAHEWIFYGWREGACHHFYGPNNVPDLWHLKKVPPQQMIHVTQKPVELAAKCIEYSSKAGQVVLDLFGGSGWTVIAAEQLGRRAFVSELSPLYADVIVNRFEEFTKTKAVRIPAGK